MPRLDEQHTIATQRSCPQAQCISRRLEGRATCNLKKIRHNLNPFKRLQRCKNTFKMSLKPRKSSAFLLAPWLCRKMACVSIQADFHLFSGRILVTPMAAYAGFCLVNVALSTLPGHVTFTTCASHSHVLQETARCTRPDA